MDSKDTNDNRFEIAAVMIFNISLLAAAIFAVYLLQSAWGFMGLVFLAQYKDERHKKRGF